MALQQGNFKGNIGGKSLYDFNNKLDNKIETIKERLLIIEDILNIKNGQAQDEFWMEIWDKGICKTYLSKDSTTWTDTNVAQLLEKYGTYLLSSMDIKDNSRFTRPKEEIELNEGMSIDDITNDKNYRLAPPETISYRDYKVRKICSSTYEDYKKTKYPHYKSAVIEKAKKDSIIRYGSYDEPFDLTLSELKTEEYWNFLKNLDIEKIKLLEEANSNQEEIKKQLKEIQVSGKLQKNKKHTIDIYKNDFMNRTKTIDKQLEQYGLSSECYQSIMNDMSKKTTRTTELHLHHVMNNLKDIKDYMMQCKLAHSNRVKINPSKCPVNKEILEHIDYSNSKHIEALLYLPKTELTFENDMSILPYDIDLMLNMLFEWELVDEKDLHIVEGLRFRITQEQIGKEIGVSQPAIIKRIKKIVKNISILNKN